MSLLREHIVGRLRSPRPSRIVGKEELAVSPNFENGLNDLPARFDHVLSRIESRITHHRIQQEGFISRGRTLAETRAVVEIHRDRAYTHAAARTLRKKSERDAFFGLNTQNQQVRAHFS